ncbi:MAG: hypothetical protein EXR83_00525 [Gammaproteobacteria bacterium]|nr:hypothetical protein [Gammaproteobacteria bacterium]
MSPPHRRPRRPRVRRGLLPLLLAASTLAHAQLEVPLAFVGDPKSSAYRGAQEGLAEAEIQGQFLGQHYTLVAATAGATAILAALPAAELQALAANHPGVAVLNLTAQDDSLRATCRANLLHIAASAQMLADARAQWQVGHPGSPAGAQVWHRSFEKYAAAQLNHRYSTLTGHPMDDAAWAGWAAVKLVSDSVARAQSAAPATLLEALRTQLAFDGQKGIDLSFRANGQLRQPLLIVENDRLVGEAPVRGVAEAEDLDSLGVVECRP